MFKDFFTGKQTKRKGGLGKGKRNLGKKKKILRQRDKEKGMAD